LKRQQFDRVPREVLEKHWSLFSIALLIIGAGWIWLSRTNPGGTTGGLIPAPKEGFLAPEIALRNTSGEIVRLSDLRGKPVLINFWASWCPPCRSEMPAIQRVYLDRKADGLVVLAVNATNQDSPAAAQDFANQNGLSFPILLDKSGEASSAYQLRSLPTSYFVDPEGIIREVVVGGPMSEALIRIRVDQLFQEKR
jgi:peroxiredoxin